MSRYTAIIRKVDGDIVKAYTEETASTLDVEFNDDELYTHIPVPSDLTLFSLKARRMNENAFELYNDVDYEQQHANYALEQIRQRRNQLLAACDWVMLSDVDMDPTKKTAWIQYRQDLRDFPSTIDPMNMSDITWPSPPS